MCLLTGKAFVTAFPAELGSGVVLRYDGTTIGLGTQYLRWEDQVFAQLLLGGLESSQDRRIQLEEERDFLFLSCGVCARRGDVGQRATACTIGWK